MLADHSSAPPSREEKGGGRLGPTTTQTTQWWRPGMVVGTTKRTSTQSTSARSANRGASAPTTNQRAEASLVAEFFTHIWYMVPCCHGALGMNFIAMKLAPGTPPVHDPLTPYRNGASPMPAFCPACSSPPTQPPRDSYSLRRQIWLRPEVS